MIKLELNKAREFKPGDVVLLKVVSVAQYAAGRWLLEADDISPPPGAEIFLSYTCGYCGDIEDAKEDGSLPEGWIKVEYQEGSSFQCPDCADTPTCRVCGCTDNHACEGGCYWVEEDLCSACEGKENKEAASK
ncbi:MAG: hypothetical protein M0Q12_00795 [Synergistaceae bacterium]|jgi:hypothetical protein|nr:hypothetical protein [Synergistaceae bacterium]